jgi:hypothetical protein
MVALASAAMASCPCATGLHQIRRGEAWLPWNPSLIHLLSGRTALQVTIMRRAMDPCFSVVACTSPCMPSKASDLTVRAELLRCPDIDIRQVAEHRQAHELKQLVKVACRCNSWRHGSSWHMMRGGRGRRGKGHIIARGRNEQVPVSRLPLLTQLTPPHLHCHRHDGTATIISATVPTNTTTICFATRCCLAGLLFDSAPSLAIASLALDHKFTLSRRRAR